MDNETRKLSSKLKKYHGSELNKEEAIYLTTFEHGTAYCSQNLWSEYVQVLRPSDSKFRPIIGGSNSHNQRLFHSIDLYSSHFVEKYTASQETT